MDSNGRRDTVEIVLENKGDSIFRCTYVPVLEGPHTVYVTFAGQQIPRSPFTVHISEGRPYTCVSTTPDSPDHVFVLDGSLQSLMLKYIHTCVINGFPCNLNKNLRLADILTSCSSSSNMNNLPPVSICY